MTPTSYHHPFDKIYPINNAIATLKTMDSKEDLKSFFLRTAELMDAILFVLKRAKPNPEEYSKLCRIINLECVKSLNIANDESLEGKDGLYYIFHTTTKNGDDETELDRKIIQITGDDVRYKEKLLGFSRDLDTLFDGDLWLLTENDAGTPPQLFEDMLKRTEEFKKESQTL